MPEYLGPGVYVEEVPSGIRVIQGAGTSTCGFVGVAERGPINQATLITSLTQFYETFGRPLDIRQRHYLGYAVEGFFREGGTRCYVVRVAHYTNILDRTTLTAEAASATFDNTAGATVLTVRAASEGGWGRDLEVSIQGSSRAATSLAADRPAGTFDRVRVNSTEGIARGSTLWILSPIFATTSRTAAGVLQLDGSRGFFRDTSPRTPLAAGAILPAGSLVLTPDFRYTANLSAALTLTETAGVLDSLTPALTNLSDGIAAPDQDVTGRPLAAGETLWIVEPDRQALAVVERLEGSTVIFTANLTTTQAFAANTRVLSRDYRLAVHEGGEVVEVFDNLSPVSTHLTDFAPTRINLGSAPSRRIRVTATSSAVPMANSARTALGGAAADPDGLTDLGRTDYVGSPASGTGLSAFDDIDDVSILAVPHPRFRLAADVGAEEAALQTVYQALATYCENRRYLFAIIDSRRSQTPSQALAFRNLIGASNYAAFYYPWLQIRPAGERRSFEAPPSGALAGLYAYTDAKRGVHKAPAGTLVGRLKSATGIERLVTHADQEGLNLQGVNVIRSFAASGLNVWGARTLSSESEWRYVNVRRLLNFIEKSIDDGTQWAVFEPNDLRLWKTIERNVGAFLRGVWRSGALFGETEDRAFRVKCDDETNTPETIELGQVITEVAVAPVTPAEFVIFRITQAPAGSTLTE